MGKKGKRVFKTAVSILLLIALLASDIPDLGLTLRVLANPKSNQITVEQKENTGSAAGTGEQNTPPGTPKEQEQESRTKPDKKPEPKKEKELKKAEQPEKSEESKKTEESTKEEQPKQPEESTKPEQTKEEKQPKAAQESPPWEDPVFTAPEYKNTTLPEDTVYDEIITGDAVITEDIKNKKIWYQGDVTIGGNVSLRECTVKITGSLYFQSGHLSVDSAVTLWVEGNFYIQAKNEAGERTATKAYLGGFGNQSTVVVKGDFYTESLDSANQINLGITLELYGDFHHLGESYLPDPGKAGRRQLWGNKPLPAGREGFQNYSSGRLLHPEHPPFQPGQYRNHPGAAWELPSDREQQLQLCLYPRKNRVRGGNAPAHIHGDGGECKAESGVEGGAVFELYAKENIRSPDGAKDGEGRPVIRYAKDELVATLTTDAKGKAHLNNLPLGSYYMKETTAGEHFVLNTEKKEFTLTAGNNTQAVVYEGIAYKNERQKIAVSLEKTDALSGEKLEGVIFGLYAAQDIVSKQGEVLVKKDTLLEKKATDKDGRLTFDSDLFHGKYDVKEELGKPGYLPNQEIWEFDTSYGDQNKNTISFSKEIKNQPTKSRFTKKDAATGKELKGAKLQIIDEDGNVAEEWTSTREPHVVYALPEGTYILHEERAPHEEGYVSANDIPFEVLEDGSVTKVEMEDEHSRTEISKTDTATGKGLKGASLRILNKDGKALEEWVSETAAPMQWKNFR